MMYEKSRQSRAYPTYKQGNKNAWPFPVQLRGNSIISSTIWYISEPSVSIFTNRQEIKCITFNTTEKDNLYRQTSSLACGKNSYLCQENQKESQRSSSTSIGAIFYERISIWLKAIIVSIAYCLNIVLIDYLLRNYRMSMICWYLGKKLRIQNLQFG